MPLMGLPGSGEQSELVRQIQHRMLGGQALRRQADQMIHDRLRFLLQQQLNFPGRAPGGTGLTGLTPGDARGYSELLNEQKEFLDLQQLARRRGPLAVTGGSVGMSRVRPASAEPMPLPHELWSTLTRQRLGF